MLIAAAAAAQRPDEQPLSAAHAGATVPVAPEIPRLRQQWTSRPVAVLNTLPRDPFAFDADDVRHVAIPSATLDIPSPVQVVPPPPSLPQLIGIVADAAADGPRYRAVLVTAHGELWLAGEGDSRDGLTVRHLTEHSADLATSEAAAEAHLAFP